MPQFWQYKNLIRFLWHWQKLCEQRHESSSTLNIVCQSRANVLSLHVWAIVATGNYTLHNVHNVQIETDLINKMQKPYLYVQIAAIISNPHSVLSILLQTQTVDRTGLLFFFFKWHVQLKSIYSVVYICDVCWSNPHARWNGSQNRLDWLHVCIWERAHREHLERIGLL